MGDVKHVPSTGMCLGTEQGQGTGIHLLSIIKGEEPALSPRVEGLLFWYIGFRIKLRTSQRLGMPSINEPYPSLNMI